MTETHSYRTLKWIDVDSPTPHEISALIDKYKLHPLVGEELLRPTRKAKIDTYKDHIYLVLHIPVRVNNGTEKGIKEKEIDFIIGKKFIITSRYELIEPLHGFAKTFETNSILDKDGIGDHAGLIFYYIMKRIYSEMMNDLENIKDALAEAERQVFQGQERKMVEVLSLLSREIIDFKQTIRLHKEVLESFKVAPIEFFGKNFHEYITDIQSTYNSIHDLILANKELLVDLRETNDSLLSTKQNEHMKLFTALAFVTFPLSLLVALFALPTSHTPIIGLPYDWEILAGGIVILAILMFAYFKEKGWI
jgi:magnesium transporter